MSERFPPLQLDDGQEKAIENSITKLYGPDAGFKWKDDKGSPIGPFAVLAYTPEIFPAYLKIADAIMQQNALEPRGRELAALAVTAVFEAPFIRYAHERIGMNVGLSREQVASAVAGQTPKGLPDTEVVIYETALKLARARGPLDSESWKVAESKLGKEGAARVGQVVAWFVYNSTLVNLGKIDVPSE